MTLLLDLADWLATYAVHSTLVVLAALGVVRTLPRRFAKLSDIVVKVAIVVPLGTSLFAIVVARADQTASPMVVLREPGVIAADGRVVATTVAVGVAVWLIVAGVRLGALIHSYRSEISALGRRRPLPAPHARVAGLTLGPVAVTASAACRVPIALWREICLPSRALGELSASELRSIVVHELAHVERRDPHWRVISAAISAVFFFQPLNRLAARTLRDLSEWICDARAIGDRGGLALAGALTRVVEWSHGVPAGRFAPSLLSRESLALRRVRAALAASPPALIRLGGFHRSAVVLIACVAALLPPVGVDVTGASPYTVRARDDAGVFAVTLRRGAVTGVTIGEASVSRDFIVQRGRRVSISDPRSEPLRLTLTTRGGFVWQSRRAIPSALP